MQLQKITGREQIREQIIYKRMRPISFPQWKSGEVAFPPPPHY